MTENSWHVNSDFCMDQFVTFRWYSSWYLEDTKFVTIRSHESFMCVSWHEDGAILCIHGACGLFVCACVCVGWVCMRMGWGSVKKKSDFSLCKYHEMQVWRSFVYTAHACCVCVVVRVWVDCAWAGGVCKEGVLVCMHEKCE